MKFKKVFFIIAVLFCLFTVACSSSTEATKEDESANGVKKEQKQKEEELEKRIKEQEQRIKEQEKRKELEQKIKEQKEKQAASNKIKYDKLQKLYVDLDENTTYEELIKEVQSKKLFYEESTGKDQYVKVALKEEVTPLRHAEEGDNVEVSFSEDGKFEYSTYYNHEVFITLLNYRDGIYYEFKNVPKYAGYYIDTYNDKAGKTKIKYANGNEAETDYLKVKSKKEQFEYMYKYKKNKK